MEEPFLFLIILLLALITVSFLVWYFSHKSKEKERLLLLEKGIDPSELPERSTFSFPWLKLGCLVTSVALGLMLGLFLEDYYGAAPPLLMFLFGGIGLIIAHYVDRPDVKSYK